MADRWAPTPSAVPADRRPTPWRNPRPRPTPPPAQFIQPCQPTLVRAPPVGPGWIHEMKHDGYRLLARTEGPIASHRCGPATEPTSQTSCARRESSRQSAPCLSENALIDGEAVVFRQDGHFDFVALRTKAGGELASFVAFDLLSLERRDLRERPPRGATRGAFSNWSQDRQRRPVQRSRSRTRPRSCSPLLASSASRGSCRSRSLAISQMNEPGLAESA